MQLSHGLLENALAYRRTQKIPILKVGVERDGAGGVVEIRNPGNHAEVVARVLTVTDAAAARMVAAAHEAFPMWSSTPVRERLRLLHVALKTLEAAAPQVARIITAENGKPLAESRREIVAALAAGFHQLEVVRRTRWRERFRSVSAGCRSEVRRYPLGVFLLVTPWNFPLATLVRKIIPALAFGNTVVAKPSLATPCSAFAFFECLARARLPHGVAHLAPCSGAVAARSLVTHPLVRGISFTGSTAVGLSLCRQTAEQDVRLQLEMGGKNVCVVLADADLDRAADAVVTAGFTCAGQWCTGTSRVIVEAPVHDAFLEKLLVRIGKIRVGPGWRASSSMGPITTREHYREILAAIRRGVAEGARLLVGGRGLSPVAGFRGNYLAPTVFDGVSENMALFQEEIFGPVLTVSTARDAEDALRLANHSRYGLSMSVFTRSARKAEMLIRGVESGLSHWNLHTAYREPALPISGWKQSGRGIPECGQECRQFFTRPRAVYLAGPEEACAD